MGPGWIPGALVLVLLFSIPFVRSCLEYGRGSRISKAKAQYRSVDDEFDRRLGAILKPVYQATEESREHYRLVHGGKPT